MWISLSNHMTSHLKVENSKPKCQTAISGGQQRHQKIPLGNNKWMLTVRQPSCRSVSSRGWLGLRVKPSWPCRRWWYYRIYCYLYPNMFKNSHNKSQIQWWWTESTVCQLWWHPLKGKFMAHLICHYYYYFSILLWRESDSLRTKVEQNFMLPHPIDFDKMSVLIKAAGWQIGHPQDWKHGKKINKNNFFLSFPLPLSFSFVPCLPSAEVFQHCLHLQRAVIIVNDRQALISLQ